MNTEMYHDDDCGKTLNSDGLCPKCKIYPDMQSLGFRKVNTFSCFMKNVSRPDLLAVLIVLFFTYFNHTHSLDNWVYTFNGFCLGITVMCLIANTIKNCNQR